MSKRALSFLLTIVALGLGALVYWETRPDSLSPAHNTSLQLATPEPAKAIVRIGTIGDEPLDEIRKFQPLIDYLNRRLGQEGYEIRGAAATTVPHMIALLERGGIDFYIDSVFPIYRVAAAVDLKILLRRWKKGVAEYHSVIFVKKSSGITSLEELRGKMIAFEDRFSSSSYALPKAALLQSGLVVVQRSEPSVPVATDEVGYVFSEDDENSIVWVLTEKVVAGAMNNLAFETLAGQQRDQLRIIHQTLLIPRHVVSYRAGLEPSLVRRVQELLLSMHETEEGRETLRAFGKTARFDPVPDEDALHQSIQQMIIQLGQLKS